MNCSLRMTIPVYELRTDETVRRREKRKVPPLRSRSLASVGMTKFEEENMNANWMMRAIWGAGCVHVGIMAANVPLPGRLRVRERLAGVPRFVRQIFYVHWVYIVIVLGMFARFVLGSRGNWRGRARWGGF